MFRIEKLPGIPEGICGCGCGEQTKLATQTCAREGWVRDKPHRFLTGHAARLTKGKATGPTKQHYEIKDCGYETSCWVWLLAAQENGYGTMRSGGRSYRAHRFYYEQQYGPVPDGKVLDHLCRNPLCVNPAHLEVVTQAENVRRGKATKLTDAERDQIRSLERQGWAKKWIGEAFGVTGNYVAALGKAAHG